jgi:hypothetical protein
MHGHRGGGHSAQTAHLKKSSETQLSEQTGEGGGVERPRRGDCALAGGLVTRDKAEGCQKGVVATESVLTARLCEREEEIESTVEYGGRPLWMSAYGDVFVEERMEM